MGASDEMHDRLKAELEERRRFQDGLVEAANNENRDLNAQEMEMYQRAQARMTKLEEQLEPIIESARIAYDSNKRSAELARHYANARNPQAGNVEYRSAGAYIADRYYAQLGDQEASQRLEVFNRVAAHQTTADNPGLLPESIAAPIVNFVDESRPIVNVVGPTDLGSGAWSYARITQHTQIAKQAGEKTELASRKMTITKTPLGADTFGGYVNISKQDINRTSPQILDMVIADLAGQYAIVTEAEMATVMFAAATAGPVIPTGTPTPATVAGAIWTAAGSVFTATQGQGRTVVAVSPDMLGLIGPIFPPVNPQNAYSTGFALPVGYGENGSIAGLTVIMSAGLAAASILVFSTAAVKAFEYRYGNLQVVEPSVWGVQVGYAGDFDAVVIQPTGIVKITKTP